MRANYIEDPQQWADSFKFSTDVRVRFSETDMYGHVNNTVLFTYFEYARIEYLKMLQTKGASFMTTTDEIVIVADLQCDYLKQSYFDDVLTICVKVAAIGTSSMDLHYLVRNEKQEICYTGRGTIVSMNPHTGKTVPISEQDKKILLGK